MLVMIRAWAGWLYVKSPKELRRNFDVEVDVTNTTVGVPTFQLTVVARDSGSPSRSSVARLLLVVDRRLAAGQPVIISSSSSPSFYGLSWSQRLFILVGSALGAALLAIVVFIVVVSDFVTFQQWLDCRQRPWSVIMTSVFDRWNFTDDLFPIYF